MPLDEHSQTSMLHEKEEEVFQTMREKLAKHIDLNTLTLDTMAFVINLFPATRPSDFKQSSEVVLVLLNRMSDDIRTAGLLSSLGYPLQAATVIAACHENAFTALSIGSDDELGDKWITHDDPKLAFGKVRNVIRQGYQNLNEPNVDSETEAEYKTYAQLCQAKHTNPLIQKLHSLRIEDNRISLTNGPDSSEQAIILASWTLEHAAHLAYLALRGFKDSHLSLISPTSLAEVREKIDTLKHCITETVTAGIAKYGNTDPFPGKW